MAQAEMLRYICDKKLQIVLVQTPKGCRWTGILAEFVHQSFGALGERLIGSHFRKPAETV